jgi:lysophospholipase L1-like esterase
MATSTTHVDEFAAIWQQLHGSEDGPKAELAARTPVLLTVGDSWFSAPLYPNLIDILLRGSEALVLRIERTGKTALEILSAHERRMLAALVRRFRFDAVLLSAGGNDFVAEFLEATFRGRSPMTPEHALALVEATGKYAEVESAYRAGIEAFVDASPGVAVVMHGYAYPRLLPPSTPDRIGEIGLATAEHVGRGQWIDRYVDAVLLDRNDRQRFARGLIDRFKCEVLDGLAGPNLHRVDLRSAIEVDALWYDEMHPNEDGYAVLAEPLRAALRAALPVAKRAAIPA